MTNNVYITYRHNKVENVSFEDLVNMKVDNPYKSNVHKIIIENDSDKYVNYKSNAHHWTTRYVWEEFLPRVNNDYDFGFNPNDFKIVRYIWDTCDFSYHDPIKDFKFDVFDLQENKRMNGGFKVIRLVNVYPVPIPSLYHSLFSLYHRSGIITNKSIHTGRRLMLNTDSMSIPVVPILACYFDSIMVLDNRTNKSLLPHIRNFHHTDYMCLMTESNYLMEKKYLTNFK